ncbi:MAG: helix-turn-helix domain-containing protein [Prevotellaceae bacterium]|jgi:transcriptional regulator with XRE-family HTH domain|nr:helix-turn-helix domain-containing protein [Prevotellaceae bacterium]
MKTRISQFLQSEQLSPARFADLLNVQRSGISHILSGRNKPGFDLIQKILTKFPDINAEWLITGRGNMYKNDVIPTLPLIFDHQPPAEPAPTPGSPPELPLLAVSDRPKEASRTISKVVILYSDNSFGDYHPE